MYTTTMTQATLAHILPKAVTFLYPFEYGAEIELRPDGRVIASDPYRLCEWTDIATTVDEPLAFHPMDFVQLRDLSGPARRTLRAAREGLGLSLSWEVGRRKESQSVYLHKPRYPERREQADSILEEAGNWKAWPWVPSQLVLGSLETARRHKVQWVRLSATGREIAVDLYPPSGWVGRFTQRLTSEYDVGVGSIRVRVDFAYWCMKAIEGTWRIPPPDGSLILISQRPLAILAGSQALQP